MLIYDRRDKNIQLKKNSLFIMWCRENWTAICKNEILNIFFHYTQK